MNGFTPNNNTNVIRLLSEAIRKCNKGRNRILMGAVVLCILTLTFVFGTAYGKINAEYTKNIRMDGTTASTYIEEGTKQQYEKARSLGYVRETGRRMKMGETAICSIQVLDQTAWEKDDEARLYRCPWNLSQKAAGNHASGKDIKKAWN